MNTYMHLQTVLNWYVFADLLFAAIVAYGITHLLFVGLSEGMLFEKWANFADGKFWMKPFGGCMACTGFWITVVVCLWMGIYNPIQIVFTISLMVLFIYKL